MGKVAELEKKLKDGTGDWEEEVFRFACAFAQAVAKDILEGLDDELMRRRENGMEVVAFKEHWLVTIFGDIRLRRRLYRDKEGNYRFLLDEKMGLEKGSHVSPRMKKLAILASTRYTFREVEQSIKTILPWGISHTTIHNLASKVADSYAAEEEKEVNALFEDGVIPESKDKAVPYLMVEADGVSVALQREKERRVEIKIGIAHEGWQKISKERYKLKEKSVYSGIMSGNRFWQGFSLTLAKQYDLSRISKVIVGGDGAFWVKKGADMLGGLYELDRFHLKRALHRGLASDPLVAEIYESCIRGEIDKVDKLLTGAQEKATGDRAKEIMKLRGYLMDNCYGLRDYRLEVDGDGLRGLGAIEGNVDKLIADRMKKRGMSWTRRGADRMARLISLREMSELNAWIKCQGTLQYTPVKEEIMPDRDQYRGKKDSSAWLKAEVPALYGPHSDRPWVQILRALTHGGTKD
ncbi:MAG: ISLre2 family transposase [Chloroflexota bacterium]|nr:ISLre2 family transposase [Chloroflexota bacterium]